VHVHNATQVVPAADAIAETSDDPTAPLLDKKEMVRRASFLREQEREAELKWERSRGAGDKSRPRSGSFGKLLEARRTPFLWFRDRCLFLSGV
jgi:hypothetical protein